MKLFNLKNKSTAVFTFVIFNSVFLLAGNDPSLQLHYTFAGFNENKSIVTDISGNNYHGNLQNGASVIKLGNFSVLNLGEEKGFIDMGSQVGKLIASLEDLTISVNIFIDDATNISDNGNFIWTFANSDDMANTRNGNMYFSVRSTRYSISQKHWENASAVNYGPALDKDAWKNVVYTQKGDSGFIYIDGRIIKSGIISLKPKDLGATTHNYLGKSPYRTDSYMKNTLLNDFRIYNRSLTPDEIIELTGNLFELNKTTVLKQLEEAKNGLVIQNRNDIISDIQLPAILNKKIQVKWISSDENIVSQSGTVRRPEKGKKPAAVKLTAVLSKSGQSISKDFNIMVQPFLDDKESVKKDAEKLVPEGNINNLRSNLNLPESGVEGSVISWKSDHPQIISDHGEIFKLSEKGKGKQKVILTATLKKGKEKQLKSFELFVAEDEGYSAYLFVYFIGNGRGEESIRFALSNDGFHYRALNDNKPVISSDSISTSGGVRDPHILRGSDGKTFYMVVTDLFVPEMGWQNYAMILLKSTDLINWTSSVINIPKTYPAEFANVNRVWAPQTIYDPEKGKYMIYWSMRKNNEADIIYYAYANQDFTALETIPKQLFYHPEGLACIDGDIVFKDNQFNLFFKTEGSGAGIKKAVSNKLTEGYIMLDKYLDQTDSPVEGAGVFKLINSDTYILMYDMYTSGTYQFTETTDLLNFSVIDQEISMNFHPRHGTVIPVSMEESEILARKWATINDLTILSSTSEKVKRRNIVVNDSLNTVYLPLKYGTSLQSFDPGFVVMPGASVTPVGEQAFLKGSVEYQVKIEGIGSKAYKVTANIDNNPVLDGYYADPEVLYSNKTGMYYIYPTSDGFTNWSGYFFKTFSSADLVNWTDEGRILELAKEVTWASRNAWAPTIIERKIKDKYKYFYYFTAAQMIGVAVADDPAGPFIDSGKPLVAERPEGINRGQVIDPDVFHDPVSDKYYLYWGNGFMACAELNEDMISINTKTLKTIKIDGTFREGTEVFYRNGFYYFMWSENDTRDADYRVRYATSDSPAGPLNIPVNNLVIAKDADRAIYGTGHNCVLQIPGKDEWYIVYHRFTRPKGITMGRAAGYNREVCIDKMEFNKDGSIKQVKPTLEGIEPVK